ncbi:MAG: GIY-YIG nuclease family protein [Rhodopirellula sp.]|nr:GIY-YIG nuclease family protein [Rhodopirellula sp.]
MRATQILSPSTIALCLGLLLLSVASRPLSAKDELTKQRDAVKPGHPAELDAKTRREVKDVARLAYLKVYDGWSTDEVLLQTELNDQFLTECHRRMPDIPPFDFNWTLLNLRKAGELRDISATQRRRDNSDAYLHAAEIAARLLEDRYSVNTDRVLCDPKLRAEYDKEAAKVAPKVEPYLLRKASLTLRKSRRLQPELVLRVADWKKEIIVMPAADAEQEPDNVPKQPGVYIFRDETGYLYIGESSNLYDRVKKHLDRSDRQSLANYLATNGVKGVTLELHAFAADSPARLKPMRRAYESELIRSRKPRFNLAP